MNAYSHLKAQQEPEIPLVDNVFAPELLASGVAGLSLMNGVLTISLESIRCDHTLNPPKLQRIIVARVAAPLPAAQALLVGLHQFLGQRGLSPPSNQRNLPMSAF